MNSSISNVFPKPAPPPPAPISEAPAPAPANGGFSQQLNKAKSKPAAAPKPQTPAPSNPTLKKTDAKSAQNKGNSKSQPDQSNSSEPPSDSDTETSPQSADTAATDSEQATAAEDATTNTGAPAQTSVAKVLVISASAAAAAASANSTTLGAKTASAKSNQAAAQAQVSTNLGSPAPDASASNADPANTPPVPQLTTGATAPRNSDSVEDSSPAATSDDTPAPVKARAIAADSAAEAADQLPSDPAGAANSTSTASPDSQSLDDGKPADFSTALQSAAQVLPDLAPALAHSSAAPVAAAAPVPPSPVAQFATTNQPSIVSTIHGSLLPNGGTMSIALNPPDLGAMQITVKMENGAMTASFQTSNEEATRLLTHSLSQLKNALENQGVAVDRLHVHQVSNSDMAGGKSGDSENKDGQSSSDGRGAQDEQQRRETLRRMWRRARGERDPLDLVA